MRSRHSAATGRGWCIPVRPTASRCARSPRSTACRVMYDRQPTTDGFQFYLQSASDLYSKTIHTYGLNGLAYGFSYDDVGGFAPVIDQPDPASGSLTLGSFGTGGGGGGGGAT